MAKGHLPQIAIQACNAQEQHLTDKSSIQLTTQARHPELLRKGGRGPPSLNDKTSTHHTRAASNNRQPDESPLAFIRWREATIPKRQGKYTVHKSRVRVYVCVCVVVGCICTLAAAKLQSQQRVRECTCTIADAEMQLQGA